MTKYCPLMSNGEVFVECIESKCMFWIEEINVYNEINKFYPDIEQEQLIEYCEQNGVNLNAKSAFYDNGIIKAHCKILDD